MDMTLTTLTTKIRQEGTLWFSWTHEKKGPKHGSSFAKTWGDHPKSLGTTIQIKTEEISQQTLSPNIIPMWFVTIVEEKGTFVLDYKNRARDHVNGVLKSQANVAVQGSSTSTLASSTQTL